MRVHRPNPLASALIARWNARFPGLEVVGADLVQRYGEPARVYHDVRHLSEVLERVDRLASEARDVRAVELAAWFHDAVYDVGAPDNEERSAALARDRLSPGLDRALVDEVVRLVLVTADHAVAEGDADAAVLCDADLGVLAASPTEYDRYVASVREEYAQVPDDDFRRGRSAVLTGLLSLPRLFNTRYGRATWEAPARDNLRRELARYAVR